MSPDVLGPGSSWQCHPGFSRLSRCCCWWRCDNDYLGTSFFFSPCVSCALFFFFPLCCWSQDQICCRCLHHPSHLAMTVSVEIMLVLHMCRYALGVRVFLCSSCCVFGSEFLQSLSSPSPFTLPSRGYIKRLQTGRLHGCCRTQHSPASSIIGNLRGEGEIQCGMN